MAPRVHGRRRAGILQPAVRTAGLGGGGGDPSRPRRRHRVSPVMRAVPRRRDRVFQCAGRDRPSTAGGNGLADPCEYCRGAGAHGRSPAGRTAHYPGNRSSRRRRPAAPQCARSFAQNGPGTGCHRRHDPGARHRPHPCPAQLSRRLGFAAGRVLRRPWCLRLRPRSPGAADRGGSLRPDAAGTMAARNHRRSGDRRRSWGRRRRLRDPADRRSDQHSRSRASGVSRLGPGAFVGRRGSAYRHRHGFRDRRRAPGIRLLRTRQPVLADQGPRSGHRAGSGRDVHGAHRDACTDRAVVLHGVPVHAGGRHGKAGDLAAGAGSGRRRADADRAAGGTGRFLPNELFCRAGADRGV